MKRSRLLSVPARIERALAGLDLNPRQAQFLRLYADPDSETFGNVYRSALAAGYAESSAAKIKGLLLERNGKAFLDVLDAAGVTDEALALAHRGLLTCGEAAGVAAGVKLGYQVRRHMPTTGMMLKELLERMGARDEEEGRRGVALLKRLPTDPHEVAKLLARALAQYRRTFPEQWVEAERILHGGDDGSSATEITGGTDRVDDGSVRGNGNGSGGDVGHNGPVVE